MRDNFDNTDNNDTQRQPEFPQGMQFGGFMGFPYFLQNLMPGQQQFQQPFGPPSGQPPFGPPSGQPPFGPPFGPPSGQPPFGPPFGPPSGQPPFGPPPGPPSGGPAGGPPSGPPPSFIPSQQTVSAFAIDPGAIRRCLFRYVYIWLDNGSQFWAWLVFAGRTSIAGWRWTGHRWVYFGVDLSRIEAFVCY